MRYAIVAALLALSACGEASVEVRTDEGQSAEAGYTIDLFAQESEQIYLVSHEDGRTAAARVVSDQSEIIEAEQARALLGEEQAALQQPEQGEAFALRAPGFDISIQAKDGEGENDSVRVSTGGGGQRFIINAEDGPDGEGRARVHITGANEQTARDFIEDAEDLSAETKTAMLAALGL